MNRFKNFIIITILLICIGVLGYELYTVKNILHNEVSLKNSYDNELKVYKSQHFDKQIKELKHINKELYDSIKIYKDKISYLIKFRYEKKYTTDTVRKTANINNNLQDIKTYTYQNKNTDSINYKLSIGSFSEPVWYKLDLKVSDNFTIVNTKVNNFNETTISTSHKGYIDNTTIISTPQKRSFWNRFSVGPSITAGYDINNNKFAVVVGVGISYKIGKN